jgi:predicted DNA-binding transcriptional regulator YafY
MNRVDRLFAILLHLQGRRVTTAASLAARFEVSLRTLYRDLAALGEAGVPLVAEAGVGYRLMPGYALVPARFSEAEALALLSAARVAEAAADGDGRLALRSAVGKVRATLAEDLRGCADRVEALTWVSGAGANESVARAVPLARLQALVAERRVLRLRYRGAGGGRETRREVEPAGLVMHGGRWHLLAWCRKRGAWRDFRADRVLAAASSAERAEPRPGGTVEELWRALAWREKGERVTLEAVNETTAEIVRRHWGPAMRGEAAADGGAVRLEFGCADIGYAARWLLGLGAAVRVVGPARLRAAVLREARAVVSRYPDVGEPG